MQNERLSRERRMGEILKDYIASPAFPPGVFIVGIVSQDGDSGCEGPVHDS